MTDYRERIELAVHTGHSMMNGIGDPEKYVEIAESFDMEAMAVTDIGTVSAFPYLHFKSKYMQGFQMIYGMDAVVVDDREMQYKDAESFLMAPTYRLSVLIRDDGGRRNLYQMISESELKYGKGGRVPTILSLQTLLEKRDGLLIGSGRYDGLLQSKIRELEAGNAKKEDVQNVLDILDYIEVLPSTKKELVKELIILASFHDIPVVAESAPYAQDSIDSVARDVLLNIENSTPMSNKEDGGVFLSTAAMLRAFDYLGEEKAEAIVIDNPHKVAGWCELEAPFEEKKHIVNTAKNADRLRDICEEELKNKYFSKDISDIKEKEIRNRLDWELMAINNTNSEYMFLNIYELAKSNNIKPYEYGSRGAIGGSLVAYLLGIAEIDPTEAGLSPYFVFDIKGMRTPDIDLNLSVEHQKLFLEQYANLPNISDTVRAGTFGYIAESTAYQFIDQYESDYGVTFSEKNKARLSELMLDTLRFKGQHPGGIMIIPDDTCLYDNMPLKNLGNYENPMMATGFDYHSIDSIFEKIDLLGHSSINMIGEIAALTNTNPEDIRIDDGEVMEMFRFSNSDLPACFGIPEFASDFVMDMMKKTKPNNFEELTKILGLAHGTNTWLGNGEELIQRGFADISEIIGSRDDIFNDLTSAGINEKHAFMIAEDVRKGKVSKGRCRDWPQYVQLMKNSGIPSWYIKSCERIGYLFPKAHAANYMLVSWRLAFYKLHYPLEFYKVMIDNCIDDIAYAIVNYGIEEFETIAKRNQNVQVGLDINSNRKPIPTFLRLFYKEGYCIQVEEIDNQNIKPARIDRENNTIVIQMRR